MQHDTKYKTRLVLTVVILMVSPLSWATGSLFSFSAGKVYGAGRDTHTSAALSGPNITIKGAPLGAASDNSGQYFIPDVPVGTYTVKVSMMDHTGVVFSSVKVEEQESTCLDFTMESVIIWREDITTDVPSPPALQSEEEKLKFVAYETLPEPMGGYGAIQRNVVYPAVARKVGIDGTVVVKAFVNAEGQVTETVILEGYSNCGLNEAAMNAIKQAKFKPAMQRDRPIGVWIAIPVHYRLHK
jgi:TonB family protein